MGMPNSLKANLKTSFAASVTVVLVAVLPKDCPHLTNLPKTVGSLSAFLAKSWSGARALTTNLTTFTVVITASATDLATTPATALDLTRYGKSRLPPYIELKLDEGLIISFI